MYPLSSFENGYPVGISVIGICNIESFLYKRRLFYFTHQPKYQGTIEATCNWESLRC